MKLTIKHLAAYLPYGVQINQKNDVLTRISAHSNRAQSRLRGHLINYWDLEDVHPLLRPLSDLTQEIEHNGESFVPVKKLKEISPNSPNFDWILKEVWEHWSKRNLSESIIEYCIIQQLLEWHFDIFSLIPSGLAIPLTTQPTQPNEEAN